MRTCIPLLLLATASCATVEAEAPRRFSVQLIVWQTTQTQACAPDAFPMDSRPERVGLGLSHWVSAPSVSRNMEAEWRAYGAEAQFLVEESAPFHACISLHRRETRPDANVPPAGASLFSARLVFADGMITVDEVTSGAESPGLSAASMLIRPYPQVEPALRWNWVFPEADAGARRSGQAPESSRVRVMVAISESGAEHQLESALSHLFSAPVPTVETAPPPR